MKRALELAVNGAGYVSPNPMVGCVIVHNDTIIGEGWHRSYGENHAEVNAINSVKKRELLSESTVYVSLEPCSHYGNTPPCADLLVKSNVRKVVICNLDPNPTISGRGNGKLKENNIEVEVGVLEEQGKYVNRRFFTYHQLKRPYVILKWAETADGFIAHENHDSKWISNNYSRQLVHKWRAEEDALLVGKNTALYDNPHLNVRDSTGKDPLRLVIDKNLSLPRYLNLFDQKQKTVCYNGKENKEDKNILYKKTGFSQLGKGILKDLYQRKILSVMIEGGTKTLQNFINQDLWDEARIFKSEKIFNKGIEAPKLRNCTLSDIEDIVGDTLFIYHRNNG